MREKKWFLITLFIGLLFLFTSYLPNLYEASVVNLLPPERIMTPAEHMYTYDYNVYLSKIKQGIEGRWSVVDKYDNNPKQKGVFLQMIYLLSGKIGGLFGFSPGLTFHLLRTSVSVFWLLTIIFLSFYFLKNPFLAFLGVLLSLFAASWPVFYEYQGTTWIGMHMSWWQEMDVLKRISYIPHYTLNYIIIAILTILLYKYEARNSKSETDSGRASLARMTSFWGGPADSAGTTPESLLNLEFVSKFGFRISDFALICFILFFSFFLHPSSGLLFLISWIIFHLISVVWFRKYNRYRIVKIAYDTIFLFLVAALPLIYFQYVTSAYPWKSLTEFDKLFRYPVSVKEYILALGPVFFTGVLGLILVLIKKERKYLSLVTWILGAFLAIFIFKKFPLQSELRFVQTANHIPLAILSVHFIFELIKFTNSLFLLGVEKGWVPASAQRFFQPAAGREHLREGISRQNLAKIDNWIVFLVTFLISGPIIALGITQSYFSLKSQTDFIHQRVVAGQPLVPYPPQVMYPLKDLYNAIVWLEKNTKNEDVVLSHIYAGNYIPAYSGNFVYLGHNPETPHYDERVRKLETFYSGTLANEDAEKFLKQERIKYVLYGPQEKQKSVEDIKKYPFLKPVFNSYHVTLYSTSFAHHVILRSPDFHRDKFRDEGSLN